MWQVGLLTELSILAAFENSLAGNLPTQLGNLPILTALRLADNRFNGSLPSEVRSLARPRDTDSACSGATRA